MLVLVPFSRSAIGMFKQLLGGQRMAFLVAGDARQKSRSSSACRRSNPPVVSFEDPLRITIRSSGSPEMFRLCSSPSTRPKRMHDDQTTSPVPRTVISVVFQRTRRLRTLYLSGIMAAQMTLRKPSMTERLAARRAGKMPLANPMNSETARP